MKDYYLRQKLNNIYKWTFAVYVLVIVLGIITFFIPSLRFIELEPLCHSSANGMPFTQMCRTVSVLHVILIWSTLIGILLNAIYLIIEIICKLTKKVDKFNWHIIIYLLFIVFIYMLINWIIGSTYMFN